MGQSAYSNGVAKFDTLLNAINGMNAFCAWVIKANAKTDEDFYIHSIKINPEINEFDYMVVSGKVSNCIWQCECVRDFLKQQVGCQVIEQDVIVCTESVSWYKGQDEEDNLIDAEEKIKNELGIDKVTIG